MYRDLREFIAEWAKSWGKDGPLTAIGLVASPDDILTRSRTAAAEFPVLTAADFE